MKLDFLGLLINSVVLSSLVFLLLTIIMIYRPIKAVKKSLKFFIIISLILFIWFTLVIFIGKEGFFSKNPFFAPWIIIGFFILFELLRRVYHSKTIQAIADRIPVPWIIGIQTYRVVGIGFFVLYAKGLLPGAFAFPAGIGDILVGVSAPFVAILYFLKKSYSKKLAIIWNIVGILDLIVALSVGFLGFPRPVQFIPLHPSTEFLSLFPLVVITLFAVPLALLLHFLSLRMLQKH